MKPNAIYSKSGKGVQEASGKTSLLKRADRAVLSAIDGRATLAEVAQKVGKSFDAEFEKLIGLLDKDGFVREVNTAPSSSASQSRPAVAPAKPAAAKAPALKPAASSGGVDDLDFTSIMPVLKPGRPPAPAAPAAKPAAAGRPAQTDATAQQRAKEQEAALYKARQEAEARAQAERDRIRQETEAKARAEAEAKIRAETEKKLREEADAKQKVEGDARAKAAREAAARLAAEVKAKAEADARARAEAGAQAKMEAELKAREEAERRARELAEKAQREAEELRQRLEAERKAREAEERRRKEEEERRRKEEDERRVREEAERQAREQAEKAQREAEKAMREAEELRQQLEQERQAREAEERKRKELEEARRAAEAEQTRAQQGRELEQARERSRARAREQDRSRETAVPSLPTLPPERAPASAGATQFGAGSLDALMADLDSFSQREEAERRDRDAAEQKDHDEKKRRVHEDAERRAREQAAEQERERSRAAEEARRREEEERRAQEEAERRVREAEEQRRVEAEERKRRAQEALAARPKVAPAAAAEEDIKVTEDDLGMDDVRRDESAVAREARKAQRTKEREARRRAQEARERAEAAAREAPIKYPKARRPVKWGRPVAIGFFVALVAAVGALHVVPLPMADYEAAASEALGRPVRIGSAHVNLFTGVRLDLSNVTIGDRVRIATVHAYPRIGSLFDDKKAFRRVELVGAVVPQQAIGGVVAARLRGRNFEVQRIAATNLRLDGPVPLPAFEADALIGPDGAVRSVTLRGPDSLDAKLTPSANGEVEFDVTAASLVVPFVPELSLASFAMKGSANGNGMKIASWGGSALDGVLGGSASVRWASAWQVDGTLTVRGINAAWFAPALLSEGKAEGSARFSMAGADPAKLHNGARMEGSFAVGKGALGTFDLSRLLQTSGRQHGGRTPFTEMTGQATYDRGAVALRNVNISAGALTAGASADIAPGGALAGRIVADVRTTLQPLRGMLVIGGTVKEPQVRN